MVEKRLAVALLLGNLLYAAPLAAQAATATATAPASRAQIFAEPTKAVEQKVASSVLIRVSPMPR